MAKKNVKSLNLDKHQRSKWPKYVLTDRDTGEVLLEADTEEEFLENRLDLISGPKKTRK